MSMVKCRECGKEISDQAVACPNCGAPLNGNPEKARQFSDKVQNIENRRKKKSRGCLITIIIFFFIGGGITALSQVMKNPDKYGVKVESKEKTDDISENEAVEEAFELCGFKRIKKIEHDELLDDAHFEGEKGYRVKADGIDNIILYMNPDNTVYQLKYADIDLYSNSAVVSQITDHTIAMDEATEWQLLCEEKVKGILKAPSTAKFPNITKWGMSKKDGKVTIQGYVDSENSFGANLRSEFQFIVANDSSTIESLIFDGEELIK